MKPSFFSAHRTATSLPVVFPAILLTFFAWSWNTADAQNSGVFAENTNGTKQPATASEHGTQPVTPEEQTEKSKQDTKQTKKKDDTKEAKETDKRERGPRRPIRKSDEDEEKRPETITFSKSKKKVDPSKTNEMTFDDIKFDMEKGTKFKRSMLTPEIESYDGATVRLRGYIRPSFRQTGLTKFVFVRDNKECCFGPGAAIFDCVLVELEKGKKTDYTVRPVTVEGSFFLKEFKGPDGKIWAIYRMKKGKVN